MCNNNNNFVVWEWCKLGFVVADVPVNCKVMSSKPCGRALLSNNNFFVSEGVFWVGWSPWCPRTVRL